MMGQNSYGQPMPWYAENDPALEAIFGNEPRPDLLGHIGIFWETESGKLVFIVDPNILYGQEPPEVWAAIAVHEILVHEGWDDSIGEELFGNLMEILTWAKLVQLNPDLLTLNTPLTQFHNLLLFILLNSQYSDATGNYVGAMSEFSDPDYNTLPGNDVGPIRSYLDFVQNISYADAAERGIDLKPVSEGGENIRQILIHMFGDDPEALQQLQRLDIVNDDTNPDFSENFIRFIDSHLHQVLTNEEAIELARLMGLEVGSGIP